MLDGRENRARRRTKKTHKNTQIRRAYVRQGLQRGREKKEEGEERK